MTSSAFVAVLGLGLSAMGWGELPRSRNLPTLTTIGQIHALSPAEAQQGYPVRVRAVVTFYYVAKPTAEYVPDDSRGNMFVQDSTGGNWVDPTGGQPALKAGDFIELEGTTAQPDFAPDIEGARWRVLGTAPLPKPVRAEFGRLASTKEDSHWVEIEGIVRSAEPVKGDLRLDIAMDGGRVVGYLPLFRGPVPLELIDAEVRIHGVSGAIFNDKNQVRAVQISIPALKDIQILQSGKADPFTIPVQSAGSILRFSISGAARHRVRIQGVVSFERRGQYAYIEARDGSARVESSQRTALKVGDVIDAVGFPVITGVPPIAGFPLIGHAPAIEQAILRVSGHAAPPVAEPVKIKQLIEGDHDGDLVQLEAQLLDRTITPDEQILIAKSDGVVLQGQLEDPGAVNWLESLEPGSVLRMTGICTVGTDRTGGPGGIRILLRSADDIRVLSRPSWLTFRHALWMVIGLSVIIFAIAAWLAILRKKIREQTGIIRGRLESEAALEQRYQHLFERNLAGVYRLKLDGRLVDSNDACAQMLGYGDRSEFLRCEASDGLGFSSAMIGLLAGSNRSASAELCLRRKDGGEIWALVNLSREDDQDGLIEGTMIEITELKQTVKKLQERTAHLSALLENNPLAIAVMDSDRRVVLCNPAFERLFLFSSAEIMGQRIDACIVPRQLAEEGEKHLQALDACRAIFKTTRRQRKDGTLVDVEAYGVPLIVEERMVGSYGIYIDIRERKAAEAELRSMKEAAEAANRAKSVFLANISHEIRTPLSGVLMAANLAAAENQSPSQKEYLDIICASGKSLQLLLNDVLDLSKIEAGKMELQEADFSIRKCLTDCVRLFDGNARQKGLALRLIVDEQVPELVYGDGWRLRQIILNLLGNAIKFTERGSITVSAAVAAPRGGKPDEEMRFEFAVADTGIGIPPEKHSSVFDEFEQAEDNTSRLFGGTGLGLAISSRLAALLGGRMWLESVVGQGSVFRFTTQFAPAAGFSDAGETELAAVPEQTLQVLLAEDNLVNRHLAVRQIERYGHAVTAVSNGREAVQVCAERHFDVILMDVHMPEMDGIEATRQIRQREQASGGHVPIIALTAGAMTQDREECLAAGMDAYLSKPINPAELLATVASVLGSSRSEPLAV